MPTSPAGNKRDGSEHGFTSLRRSAEHGFTSLWRSAEHGFTSSWRSAEHGFTLVELMVVVTIIALGAAAAVWAMPDPQGRLTDEAARFATRARAAHDQAIVTARPVSVWVTNGGYGFDARVRGNWQALPDRPFRVERWQEGTRVRLAEPGRTRVTFDPTGLADRPLDIRLERRGAAATVRIEADGSARVNG